MECNKNKLVDLNAIIKSVKNRKDDLINSYQSDKVGLLFSAFDQKDMEKLYLRLNFIRPKLHIYSLLFDIKY